MYQIKIDGQKVGKLMPVTEARKWRRILSGHFSWERVSWVKVH